MGRGLKYGGWIIVTWLLTVFACRSNPFGNTPKSIEEFNVYTSDFTAQNDGGAKSALLEVIGGAKVTLNCAFSTLTLTDVTSSLIDRARAGVQVKIAFDLDVRDSDTGSLSLQSSGAFVVVTSPIDTNQSQLLYGNGGSGYMRHNFCLADERYIYISTAAPDDTQMRKTPNIAFKIGSPQFGIARDFLRESNMFSQLLFGNGKAKTDFTTKFTALNQVIGAYWGPQESPLDVLGTGLSEAQTRVDFYSTAFQTTNSSKSDLDVPQVLQRLESAKGVPLGKYFSTQALFDTSSKAYTLTNPAQYINSSVRIGANIFVMDRGSNAAKTYIYTGALRSQGNSSDDSVLLELRGRYVADIVGAYLDRIGAVSIVASNTGDTSTNGAVVINEINWAGSYANSTTSDSNDEFLELLNTTASAINISGWKFACTTDGGTTVSSFFQMPSGAVIPANGFFTVAAKSTGAFPNASYYTSQLGITNSSKECKLTNGKAAPASTYAGQAGLTGDVIDTAGDGTNAFDNSGNVYGTNDSTNKIRRSMERKQPITAGNLIGSWQSNVNSVAQNTDIDSQFNQKTFGTPGAATSVPVPSVTLNRTLYFTTSATHPNGVAKISAVNIAANTNSATLQTIIVNARSTSDATGINLTLTETGVNAGTFSSTATGTHLNFTTGASAGNQLRVASGDTVTISYTYSGTTYTATALWYQQNLMINEIGSNCGGTTANDYIEILNPNAQSVSLSGMTIYRDSGSSGTACTIGASNYTSSINLSGSISANSYILAAGSTYTAGGACPTPDFTATSSVTIDVSDCIALVLSGAGPATATDDEVVDFVGYGNAANAHEGAAVATEMGGSNNQCISRNPNGTDTNVNSADFINETSVPCSPKGANGSLSVVSASAGSNATTITVTFNAAPNTVQAQTSGNYCIALASAGNCSSPQLTVSAAVLAGSTVTLTTTAQTASAAYTVYVTGVTLAASGGALSTNSANFTGYVPPPAGTPGSVIINEIVWSTYNSSGLSDAGDDMIELRNTTSAAIDISGWTIVNAGTSGSPNLVLPASSIIAANGYFVIAAKTTGVVTTANWTTSSLDLLSGGELLTLQDLTSATIDTANQAGAWFKGLDDTTNKRRKSMERNLTPGTGTNAGDWHTIAGCGSGIINATYSGWTVASPGSANSAGTEGDCGRVQMNKATFYTTSATATVTVIDSDMNTNSGLAETLNVIVKSATTDTVGEALILTETGVNTGIFSNSTLGFETVLVTADGKVAVSDNETVTVSYTDSLPSGTRTATAVWRQNVSQKIIINEINWMGSCGGAGTGTTADTTDEWVELYNNTAAAIDFSVTPFSFYSNGSLQATINSGVIASDGYFVLARKASGSSALTPGTGADFWSSGISLNNSAVQWILYDGATSAGDASDIAEDGVGTPPGGNGNCSAAGNEKKSMSRNNPGGAVPKVFGDGTQNANWHSATTVKGGRYQQTSPDYDKNWGTPGAVND